MKLHLPVLLRKALLACFAFTFACSATSAAADLTLGGDASLTIDYAAANSIPDLAGGTLQLSGDTVLLLSNCGVGDGKTYTLLTGVGALSDADGNPLTLRNVNNAASLYFDTSRPGSGFWADGWLQLASDGSVQLVLHAEDVQAALTITTRQIGSVDYSYYSGISFKNLTTTDSNGGAIYGSSSTITLSNNGSVVFEGNTASSSTDSALGGAIYGNTITLSNNGSVEFVGNTASTGLSSAHGGAIYGGSSSPITLSDNGSVEFIGNTASSESYSAEGGAIFGGRWGSTITLSDNGSVEFIGNTASGSGYACGGAIYGGTSSTITLSDNGSVEFSGNTASSGSANAFGGAIYGASESPITLSDNGSVEFIGNKAISGSSDAWGGAIFGRAGVITLSDNGNVMFADNIGGRGGGAICYHDGVIRIERNEEVLFIGNSAYATDSSAAHGGAICYTCGNLSIRNNDFVLFEKNAEISNGSYRLRSIYAYGFRGDVISLSAEAGKSIEFRDSVYVGSVYTVNLNEDYTYVDADGKSVTVKQKGDILFTGEYTEKHLNELLEDTESGRTATTEEILTSRTTEVHTVANLYNGRLIIKEGAVWAGDGITVAPAEGTTYKPVLLLQNAHLTHYAPAASARNAVTIKTGAALELSGRNTTTYTNVFLGAGSTLVFDISSVNSTVDAAVLSMNDSTLTLPQSGAITLKLILREGGTVGQTFALLSGENQPENWDSTNIAVTSGNTGWDVSYDDLYWDNNTLLVKLDQDVAPAPSPEPEPMPKPEFAPNLDRNQQSVYDMVQDIAATGNPGGVLGLLAQEISGSRDEAALKRALDALSGREYAGIMNSQIEGNLGHLRRLRASAGKGTPLGEYVTLGDSYASNKGVDKSDNKGASVMIAPSPVIDSRRIRAGVAAFHEQGELDADRNGDGFERSETGAQLTMEYLVSKDFVLGMGISQSRTKLTPSYGKRRDEDNTHFDLYGVYQSGRWSSTTVIGVGLHQYELGRSFAGMSTDAETDGFSVNSLQDVAYTVWADEQQGVQVFGSVESSFNMIDAFSESGAGNASLLVDEQDAWATDVTLGLRYNRALPALGKALPGSLTVQTGVVASLGDRNHEVSMHFAGAADYGYKQYAAERSLWGYNVGVSVNLPVTAETALYGSAEAVIRNASTSVDAQLGVKMAF